MTNEMILKGGDLLHESCWNTKRENTKQKQELHYITDIAIQTRDRIIVAIPIKMDSHGVTSPLKYYG